MDRATRFKLFIQTLQEADNVATFVSALELVETSLNSIEDRYSGVPFEPSNWADDGRMYPPQEDSERRSPLKGVRRFRTRAHVLDIGINGAIRITHVHSGHVEIDKPGADELTVEPNSS